jgi:hypothetical protein
MIFKQWLLEMVFFLIELIERVVLESLFLKRRGPMVYRKKCWFIDSRRGRVILRL